MRSAEGRPRSECDPRLTPLVARYGSVTQTPRETETSAGVRETRLFDLFTYYETTFIIIGYQ